jgi:hypothetical protein
MQMKTFIRSAIMVASTTLLFAQCKKDEDTAPAAKSFTPLTAGTNWTYQYTEGATTLQTFKLTVTSKDTVANGRTYKVLTTSNGGANNYLAQSNSEYYRLTSIPQVGLMNVEELYLKDNENVNGTWTKNVNATVSGTNITAAFLYTIKGKGESRPVGSQTYQNVTHVHLDISAPFVGNVGSGDFYYAEGIGMVESNIVISNIIVGNYSSSQKLLSYEIK